jgi:hypothetical protein
VHQNHRGRFIADDWYIGRWRIYKLYWGGTSGAGIKGDFKIKLMAGI